MHNRNFGFAESQARFARPLLNSPRGPFSWRRAGIILVWTFLAGLGWCLVGYVAWLVLS